MTNWKKIVICAIQLCFSSMLVLNNVHLKLVNIVNLFNDTAEILLKLALNTYQSINYFIYFRNICGCFFVLCVVVISNRLNTLFERLLACISYISMMVPHLWKPYSLKVTSTAHQMQARRCLIFLLRYRSPSSLTIPWSFEGSYKKYCIT